MLVCKNENQIQIVKPPLFISSLFFFCKSGVGQRIEPSTSYQRLARFTFLNASIHTENRNLFCNSEVLISKRGGTTFSVDISNQFCQRSNFKYLRWLRFTERQQVILEFIQTLPGFQLMQQAHKPSA